MPHAAAGNGIYVKEPYRYEVHIKEPLDPRWVSWFEGMTISQAENRETVLSGPVVDRSALHGMLAMIGELNLTLISVKKIDSSNP